MDEQKFLTGRLLLAMPGIGDPRFERAVIAMCSHDASGALGIGIGHHLADVSLHTLLDQFEIDTGGVADAPIHAGGPCEPQRGFVLHSDDWGGQGTINVAGRWALSSTIDVLRVLDRAEGPSQWLVALGYAGWGEGQLDTEMRRHGWHVADGNAELIFDTSAALRWKAAFNASGVDPALLAPVSGNA
jgi:putative transcriptional regulator